MFTDSVYQSVDEIKTQIQAQKERIENDSQGDLSLNQRKVVEQQLYKLRQTLKLMKKQANIKIKDEDSVRKDENTEIQKFVHNTMQWCKQWQEKVNKQVYSDRITQRLDFDEEEEARKRERNNRRKLSLPYSSISASTIRKLSLLPTHFEAIALTEDCEEPEAIAPQNSIAAAKSTSERRYSSPNLRENLAMHSKISCSTTVSFRANSPLNSSSNDSSRHISGTNSAYNSDHESFEQEYDAGEEK